MKVNEIWKPVVGFEGFYEVSNYGRVKSLQRLRRNRYGVFIVEEKILKQLTLTKGYLGVRLYKNNKGKTFKVHRLVAEAFIPNPDNLACVNHKDEIKTNNMVDNLEWCTSKYNTNYGTCNKRKGLNNRNNSLSKPVIQYKLNGEFVAEDPSICESERITGIRQPTITKCCKGQRKNAGGYIWKYKEVA